MKRSFPRALIEIGFIMFLFYANLLMGEFEHSGAAHSRGLLWALSDIFSAANLVIAVIAAAIGYLLFEYLRARA